MIVRFPFNVAAAKAAGGIVMPEEKQIQEPDDLQHYWPNGAAIRKLYRQKGWTRQQLLDIANTRRDKEIAMGVLERCLKSGPIEPLKVKIWNLEAFADELGVDVAEIALSVDEVEAARVTWKDLAASAKTFDGLELVADDRAGMTRAGLVRAEHRPRFPIGEKVRIRLALKDPWSEWAADGTLYATVLWIDDRDTVSCVFPLELNTPTPGLVTGGLLNGLALITI